MRFQQFGAAVHRGDQAIGYAPLARGIGKFRDDRVPYRLLHQLMQGKTPQHDPVLIDPSEVAVRTSTDVLHIDDPAIKKAVNYMRSHFAESFKMDQVAEVAGVSRRLLEMRFRAERKTSPAEFLVHLRIQKAKGMLASRNRHPAEEIARVCGFGTGKNLRAAFQRILNASPNEFRTD